MTGPPYPRYIPGTGPGQNAIGSFVIGVSPIGTIPPFDVWSTIISQYANSPILTQLIENFYQYLDQTKNFDEFFDDIWNVDTAIGYGLDVWGRIVGISRVIRPPQESTVYFGFKEATDAEGFGLAPFFVAGGQLTQNFELSDGSYRTLIFAKALSNISDGSIPSINQMLLNLFPNRGKCYVVDGEDMTMVYTFDFALSAVELAIVQTSGALPKPVGVSATVISA